MASLKACHHSAGDCMQVKYQAMLAAAPASNNAHCQSHDLEVPPTAAGNLESPPPKKMKARSSGIKQQAVVHLTKKAKPTSAPEATINAARMNLVCDDFASVSPANTPAAARNASAADRPL